jgi:polysaccharide biosynthesis protein VpsQ
MASFQRNIVIRWLTLLFALFLLIIVMLANLGLVAKVFGWLYNYPNGDKVGHFFLMGILAFLASLAFRPYRVRIFKVSILRSSLIIAILVALEEISQQFFPNRTASFLDLAASLAGILLLGELGVFLKSKIDPIGH